METTELELIQEYPQRELLWFKEIDSDFYAIMKGRQTNKAHFMYSVSNEVSFDFDLLSHCNKIATSIFEEAIKKNNLKLSLHETKTEYYETIS